MTNLTEQWKKGKLPEGEEYLVILTDEWYLRNPVEPVRAFYSCDCEFEGYYDDDIKEILAPVPSYDELQNMNKAVNECMAANIKLVEQNAQLKELLKECFEYIDWTDGAGSPISQQELLDKIDEVLK